MSYVSPSHDGLHLTSLKSQQGQSLHPQMEEYLAGGHDAAATAWLDELADLYRAHDAFTTQDWPSDPFQPSVDALFPFDLQLGSIDWPEHGAFLQPEEYGLAQDQDLLPSSHCPTASIWEDEPHGYCHASLAQHVPADIFQPGDLAWSDASHQWDTASWPALDGFKQISQSESGSFSPVSPTVGPAEAEPEESTSLFYMHRDNNGSLTIHDSPPPGTLPIDGKLARILKSEGYVYVGDDGSASKLPPM